MRFNLHIYHHIGGDVKKIKRLLRALITQGEQIMSSQQDAAAQVATVNEKLTKIGTETRSLLTKIDELKTVIEEGAELTPELEAAIQSLSEQAQVVDDLVPDAT